MVSLAELERQRRLVKAAPALLRSVLCECGGPHVPVEGACRWCGRSWEEISAMQAEAIREATCD